MIAGTCTPFTVPGLTGHRSWGLTTIVWSLALPEEARLLAGGGDERDPALIGAVWK